MDDICVLARLGHTRGNVGRTALAREGSSQTRAQGEQAEKKLHD